MGEGTCDHEVASYEFEKQGLEKSAIRVEYVPGIMFRGDFIRSPLAAEVGRLIG